MYEYESILADQAGGGSGVALITLNCPERMNVLTARMDWELRHAIATFDAMDEVRAIVVTGSGRAFCAGADVSSGALGGGGVTEDPDPTNDYGYGAMNTPVIAAMNGSAAGGGLTIPLVWDFRVMADEAKYTFVFNRRGLLPELGSTWMLPRLVGFARAADLLITGRIFTGQEAAAIGLANASVPAAEVLERSLQIARDIADNTAPVSVALTKQLLLRHLTNTDRITAEAIELELLGWANKQADAGEGIQAFFEKRPAVWKMGKNSEFPTELYESLTQGGHQ